MHVRAELSQEDIKEAIRSWIISTGKASSVSLVTLTIHPEDNDPRSYAPASVSAVATLEAEKV